jgi:pimeloyl-ACP methyl ester carboxylesterase
MHWLLSNDDALHAGLREVKAPIVLINSDYHPTNFAATNRAGMRVELMSGVGHFVMLEDAETFNDLLEAAAQRMWEQNKTVAS